MSTSASQTLAKYGVLLCAQMLAAWVFVVLSRAESGRPTGVHDVPCVRRDAPKKLTLVFVDSLSDRVARDPKVMPKLVALAQAGVSLEVTPCRDQLTYLCLRALLTGYDESSLLAVRGNFTHAASTSDNLLDRLAEAGRRVVVVGSHDFEAYEKSVYRAKLRDGDAQSEALALSDLAALDPARAADVTLISLSNGDRTAHAFGTHSPKYREAFGAIDDLIAEAVTAAGPSSDVLVFGDHGHDEMGRHLPGLSATAFALYVGPSFRQGVRLRAALTDHRAILGALLGVPTPPSYTGPELQRLFAPSVSASEGANFTALRAPPERHGSHALRVSLALATLLAASWIGQRALLLAGLGRGARWGLAGSCALLMAAAGAGYDAIRLHIHDHGYEPIRSLWLLVPLGLGFALAAARRSARASWRRFLVSAAFVTVLVCFCLLFPTAYYYGASRGTVLAGIIAVALVLVTRMRALRSTRSRVACGVLGLSVAGSLWSLYGLQGVGGRTREMAYFVLSSPLFGAYAGITLCVVKVALLALFARTAQRSRWDLLLAAGLFGACFWLERSQVPGARYLLLWSALGWLGMQVAPRSRWAASRFALGLIALGQCYGPDPQRVAPMQMLFLCVVAALEAWRACFVDDAKARAAASGVTLAVAGYLMLWPTVGMRFSGIDFHFMFEWVPIARYEELWWLIGLGMLLKFAFPYALLVELARRHSPAAALNWAYVALALKLTALTVFAAWYATSHALLTNGALEIMAELALLLMVSAFAWPSPARAGALIWSAKRRPTTSACTVQEGAP